MMADNERNPLSFPEFPVEFTEEDASRMKKLEEQDQQLKELYTGKTSQQAWDSTPVIEKVGRNLLAPLANVPVFGDFMPALTPEQVETKRIQVKEELDELVRRQYVYERIPSIQEEMQALALIGYTITDSYSLDSHFKDIGRMFNEEEKAYLVQFGSALAKASPEEIVNGTFWDNTSPLDSVDYSDYLIKEGIDPRYITSIVSFSKDTHAIQSALESAYPPNEGSFLSVEEAVNAQKDNLQSLFRKYGLEFDEENIAASMEKLSEAKLQTEGLPLPLQNIETGENVLTTLYPATEETPATVWYENNLMGFYNENTKEFLPFSVTTGEVIEDKDLEEQNISEIKSIWHKLLNASNSIIHGAVGYFKYDIPASTIQDLIDSYESIRIRPLGLPIWTVTLPIKPPRTKVDDYIVNWLKELQEGLSTSYEASKEKHTKWVLEDSYPVHPKHQIPPKERIQEEGLASIFEPSYLFAQAAEIIPSIAGTIAVTLGIGALTKNPALSLGAGSYVLGAAQAHDITTALTDAGYSLGEASMYSRNAGVVFGAMELGAAGVLLKGVAPGLFRKIVADSTVNTVKLTKAQLVKKGLRNFTENQFVQTMQEVAQEGYANAILANKGAIDSFFDGLDNVALQTFLGMLPLSAFGGGNYARDAYNRMPKSGQEFIVKRKEELIKLGMDDNAAETKATLEYYDTPEGQKVKEKIAKEIRPLVENDMNSSPAVQLHNRLYQTKSIQENTFKEVKKQLGIVRSKITRIQKKIEKLSEAPEVPAERRLVPLRDFEEGRNLLGIVNRTMSREVVDTGIFENFILDENAKIADTANKETLLTIIDKALENTELSEEQVAKLKELRKFNEERTTGYLYIDDLESLNLDKVAKELGYNGLRVWTTTDSTTTPSAIILTDAGFLRPELSARQADNLFSERNRLQVLTKERD